MPIDLPIGYPVVNMQDQHSNHIGVCSNKSSTFIPVRERYLDLSTVSGTEANVDPR